MRTSIIVSLGVALGLLLATSTIIGAMYLTSFECKPGMHHITIGNMLVAGCK